MDDSPRIRDLRRRLQLDPASIAFAQLAEEYRRGGECHEAVETCRTGLVRHPNYVSARVTLGRALLELGQLDEAQQEFELVLEQAPENLTALRSLGETHQRQGAVDRALARFQEAFRLAPNDPELEELVADLSRQLAAEIPPGLAEDQDSARLSDLPRSVPERQEPLDGDRARSIVILATLERWLAAVHVARAQQHASS